MSNHSVNLTDTERDLLFHVVASTLGERRILHQRRRKLGLEPAPDDLREADMLAAIAVKLTPPLRNTKGDADA